MTFLAIAFTLFMTYFSLIVVKFEKHMGFAIMALFYFAGYAWTAVYTIFWLGNITSVIAYTVISIIGTYIVSRYLFHVKISCKINIEFLG